MSTGSHSCTYSYLFVLLGHVGEMNRWLLRGVSNLNDVILIDLKFCISLCCIIVLFVFNSILARVKSWRVGKLKGGFGCVFYYSRHH